jgi:hypothetical protein
MLKAFTKNYFHILLACLFISACSHAPPKVRTEGPKPPPASGRESNYSQGTNSTSMPAPVSPEKPQPPEKPREAVKSVPPPSGRAPEPPPATPPRSTTPPPSAVLSYSPGDPVLRETRVIWSYVNLREGPGLKYKVVGKATRGASLSILEEKGGWLRVRLEDGEEVWMAKVATSEGNTATSRPSPSQESSSPKVRSPM